MIRVTRVYISRVEGELNQMQAHVVRLRDEGASVTTASVEGKSEPIQFKAADELELRICDVRKVLTEFKQAENFKRKRELQEEIEKRLYELMDYRCVGNRRS